MNKKYTIETMNDWAKKKGGICISSSYKGPHIPLKWKCGNGHVWPATPNNIHRSTWCPYCAGRHQTISDMQALASAKGGRCLSKSYVNAKTKLKWQCENGHKWEALPSTIKRHRCPHCSNLYPLSLQEMQTLAAERGGKCISTVYKNTDTPLKWECDKGHPFNMTPDKVKYRHQWCPTCAGRRKTIADLREWAAKRGGKCISQKYTGIFEKYEWECAERHQFRARASDINSGTWCPYCSQSVGESVCRHVMEELFNTKFPKARPEILKINETTRLEFDGYSEKLKIAFEYQGRQHFEFVDWIQSSEADLSKQKDYDRQKRELCRIHAITLIEIPHTVPLDELVTFIKARCIEFGLSFSDRKRIQLSDASPFRKYHLNEIRAIVAQKGGKCLSGSYVNAKTRMKFKCHIGHQFWATPTNIKSGRWCPYCLGKNKTIEEIKEIAKERGGLCLSKHYRNNHTNLKWQCAEGHIWKATFSNVNKGTWCPVCAGIQKLTIDEMYRIAKERGGKCLSKKYVNNRTNLLWECNEKHKWWAIPAKIKGGTWCPKCAVKRTADKQRGDIVEYQNIAKSRGGRCLSNSYVNYKTKLQFECKEGHKWWATPSHIKEGSWCPVCAKRKRQTK